jgi:BirA family transcriptional regulator, biotin operon repressor / biotin---[acetyl-CoA-carboxylase] ligase
MDLLPVPSPSPSTIDERLIKAVGLGLIEPGLAQRIRLSIRLQSSSYARKYTAQTEERAAQPDECEEAPDSGALSGEALGRILGLSRAMVHKHVDHLRGTGFAIESAAGAGYRLAEPADDLMVAEVVIPHLLESFDPDGPWSAGLPYLYMPTCESTNLVLRQAVSGRPAQEHRGRGSGDATRADVLPAGAVVATDHQASGRGRLGRSWNDETGKELMFSVLLRPSLAPGQAHLLSLAAALAVAQTLELLPGLAGRVKVKWPNDVLIDGGKVCGILVEGSMDADRLHWVVAGIGVNVNGDFAALAEAIALSGDEGADTRPRPAYLRECLGAAVPRAPLFAALLTRLTAVWAGLEDGAGVERLLAGLRERDALAGTRVEVYGGSGAQRVVAAGEAVGIGAEGQLLLRTLAGETLSIVAGDVSLRRRPSTP